MNTLAAIFCIILFSLTVPFTRMAAFDTPPEAIILFRLLGAGTICFIAVLWDKWIPPKRAWKGILLTSFGSVIGFSSLTAFAMKEVPAGHAAVALAAMPIVTAAYSSLRDRFNPGWKFWLFALMGTMLSFSFFFFRNVGNLLHGDFLLLLAVFAAAFGYVEGGRLSREYGGRRVMSWAIVATLPVILPTAGFYFSHTSLDVSNLSMNAWISVAYLALVSQSSGMFLWFKVLAIGPMEKVALIQLLQPFLTLLASILFLNETVLWSTWIIAALVAVCILGANREKRRAA